ncbi:MAG: signal transduction histidine kinase [Betaproteobacteria bacterium]|nr:signal transduction histidine kinase [Betaproteobacteria bacterium]
MNTFPDLHGILTAFFGGLPWPIVLVNERGQVTYMNRLMQAADALPNSPEAPFASRFPEYAAALGGETPWLTAQTAAVIRNVEGRTLSEQISVHCLPIGACLIAIEQPDTAATLGDAQLARLASLGFMVAGVCHELANPLTAINSTVQLLRANPAAPALLDKGLANIAGNVERMLSISRRLNDFSRASDDARALLNLRTTVNDAVALLKHGNSSNEINVVCALDDTTIVHADPGQLQQVFCNVFTNAVQAMHGSGSLYICDSRPDGRYVEIAIHDTGPGIAESDLPRLFEPFFTTKPPGAGTGLGLAISNEIVLAHGGSMRAANEANGGACFYIRLPAVSP